MMVNNRNKKKTRLYVGCGNHRLDGFIHTDINILKNKHPNPPDFLCDMTHHIPLEDNNVDFIWSRGTIEHLTYRELVNHFLECARILKHGGIVRSVVPDFDKMINDYKKKKHLKFDEILPDLPNNNYVETFITQVLYHDHYYLHNEYTLKKILGSCGFSNAKIMKPGLTKDKEISKLLYDNELDVYKNWSHTIVEAEFDKKKKQEFKKFNLSYSGNLLNKFLIKFFNLKLSNYNKRRPCFPTKAWFVETITKINKIKSHD